MTTKFAKHTHTHIYIYIYIHRINTLRPRQNCHHFANDIFKCIFLNENVWLSLKISLKFVPEVRINNIPALIQIMAWRRPGAKPLSEPIMVKVLTHICVIPAQWVKMRFHAMMTSSNGNIFRVTGHLCGEFTGHRWIPRIKASDAELWWFLWSAPEYTVE